MWFRLDTFYFLRWTKPNKISRIFLWGWPQGVVFFKRFIACESLSSEHRWVTRLIICNTVLTITWNIIPTYAATYATELFPIQCLQVGVLYFYMIYFVNHQFSSHIIKCSSLAKQINKVYNYRSIVYWTICRFYLQIISWVLRLKYQRNPRNFNYKVKTTAMQPERQV